MISFLKGIIESKKNGIINLDVGGVGYELFVSTETFSSIGNVGDKVLLHTYLVLRENEVFLIGFKKEEEKNLFLHLTTVSGVGPKTALQILSGNSYASIISSITSGDTKLIASTKGIGKKTAERIILELKEKFAKEFGSIKVQEKSAFSPENGGIVSDAILALVSLGLTKQEAEGAVLQVYRDGMVLEEIISKALRRI